MPEVDLLFVHYQSEPEEGPNWTWEVELPDQSLVAGQHDLDFAYLAKLAAEHGVTRWATATDEDRSRLDERSFHADTLVIVGWVEVPIGRDDVQISYHNSTRNSPMINVKDYSYGFTNETWASVLEEFDGELDPRLASLTPEALRALVEGFLGKKEWPTDQARESHWEYAESQAKDEFFAEYDVKVWAAGRSGGWLVVQGLPPVETWNAELLTKWHEFSEFCAEMVADLPRAAIWHALANGQDELAGRVHTVQLHMVLCDEDLEAGDPITDWDWRGMLDLSLDSTITITKGT